MPDSPLRCPRCGEPAGLFASQRLTGCQHYTVKADENGPYLEAFEHEITGRVGRLTLVCDECNHTWRTNRRLPVRGTV